MCGPTWPFLLMYGSHDMRHTSFRGLTVVNGPPGFGASHHISITWVNEITFLKKGTTF